MPNTPTIPVELVVERIHERARDPAISEPQRWALETAIAIIEAEKLDPEQLLRCFFELAEGFERAGDIIHRAS